MKSTQVEKKAKAIKKAASKRSKSMRERTASEFRDELLRLSRGARYVVGGRNSEVVGRILNLLAWFVGSTHPCARLRQFPEVPEILGSIQKILFDMREKEKRWPAPWPPIDGSGPSAGRSATLQDLKETVATRAHQILLAEGVDTKTPEGQLRTRAVVRQVLREAESPGAADEAFADQFLAKFSKKAGAQ